MGEPNQVKGKNSFESDHNPSYPPNKGSGTGETPNQSNSLDSANGNHTNINTSKNSNNTGNAINNNSDLHHISNAISKSALNTPAVFPFDLSGWEDAPDLNFLLDSQHHHEDSPSILSNVVSPLPNTHNNNGTKPGMNNNTSQLLNVYNNINNLNGMNTMNYMHLPQKPETQKPAPNLNPGSVPNMNAQANSKSFQVSSNPNQKKNQNQNQSQGQSQNLLPNNQQNPSSPADYASQLQHYQNLLVETQNLLNMKQMQQKSPNPLDSNNHQANKNAQFPINQPQISSLLTNNANLDLNNFQAFFPNLTATQQTLLQQQILQLAQAQLSNNKLFNNQFNPSLATAVTAANLQQGVQNIQSLNQASLPLQSLMSNSLNGVNNINTMNNMNSSNIQIPSNMLTQQNSDFNGKNPINANNRVVHSNSSTNPHSSINFNPNINNSLNYNINKSRKKPEIPQPRTKVRPCDHCRRRKTKCIMLPEIHSCKLCQQKGLKCTFNESASLKRSMTSPETDNKRMKFEDPTIEPPPNIQVRDTHPIKDYSTMQGHSLLKKTLSLQFPRSSFYIGPTSIYDPLFLDKVSLDKIDQFQINKSNSIRKVASSIQFLLRDDFSELLYEQSERDSDTVEKYVAPHGQTLINLYFRTIHPSFPVLHKKIFLEKYARTHREFGAPLLAAVYLLAIQWWDYEPKLAKVPKPDVLSLHRFAIRTFGDIIQRPKLSAVQAGLLLLQCQSMCSSNILNLLMNKEKSSERDNGKDASKSKYSKDKNKDKGKDKEKEREKALERDIEIQLQISNQNNWLLCTQVVGLAEELGLGLDCSTWRLPKWERGLRRRLAWAVYVQDKWSSLVESRPSHINDNINWIVKPLTDEDFPERLSNSNDSNDKMNSDSVNNIEPFANVDIELGKESFKHTVSLSIILSEIQSALYTPRAMEDINKIENVLKIAKPIQLKLKKWYHSLPKNLQMGSRTSKNFNTNGNLQLSYFATEITLHRRIISTLHNQMLSSRYENDPLRRTSVTSSNQELGSTRSSLNNNNGENNANSNVRNDNNNSDTSNTFVPPPPPPSQLVEVCRNAARTRLTASISFVRELTAEHMHSFWHSSAARNFALIGIFATLLYVTSADSDEAAIYREYITDYRWILKLNAESFGVIRESLTLIDGIIRNIPGLWNEYDGISIDHVSNVRDDINGNDNNQHSSGGSNVVRDAANRKNAPSSYSYDLSNGVSPRTIVSPNTNDRARLKNRRKANELSGSNMTSPANSPYPPSPLQSNNIKAGKVNTMSNINTNLGSSLVKSRPTSPMLLMSHRNNTANSNAASTAASAATPTSAIANAAAVAINNNNSNNNDSVNTPNENGPQSRIHTPVNSTYGTAVRTPTTANTPTPTLVSQSKPSTPPHSATFRSSGVQPRTAPPGDGGNSRPSPVHAESIGDSLDDKSEPQEVTTGGLGGDGESHTTEASRKTGDASIREKAQQLFKCDGQESILNMTTALGLTSSSGQGIRAEEGSEASGDGFRFDQTGLQHHHAKSIDQDQNLQTSKRVENASSLVNGGEN